MTRARPDTLESLREKVREQQETLDAIRSGEVDALVVMDPKTHGEKLFTLQGADFAFRTMLEQMGEGAASASSDGTVLYVNRAFARLCGRPMDSATGASLVDLVAPPFRPGLAKALREAARRTARLEATLASGVPALLTLSPLSGKPPAVAVVATDLRLRALNVELERGVKERASALQAANRELEAFNYSVSHDLKAPARQIGMFADMLEREHASALGPDGALLLARIKQGAKRLSDIINGMLELSRATLTEVDYRTVDLTELARSIVDDLRSSSPRRNVKAVVAPNMALRGDETLLRLALQNLLANAWKFTSTRKKGLIEVGFEDAKKGIIRVRDNGIGFDMRYTDKLFQPFQRLHKPEDFPGTGIGLSIVQRAARRLGGRVWARSKPNHGSTFYIQIGHPAARS